MDIISIVNQLNVHLQHPQYFQVMMMYIVHCTYIVRNGNFQNYLLLAP